MRENFLKLRELGQMPTESINDNEKIIEVINEYDDLLSTIKKPITLEEAEILVSIFPDGFFYDLHWDLLHLFENCILNISEEDYQKLIEKCPSKEWRENLQIRYENWKNKQKNFSNDI